MKWTLSLIFGLSFCVCTSYGQIAYEIPAFDKIDTGELTMKDCPFSPGAPALNLLKYEEVTLTVFPNYSQVTTLTRYRIKILKKSGFKYASIVIDYGKNDTKISDIEGATYNLDETGQIKRSPVAKSDIFEAKSSKEQKTIAFTFPQVKEGSVIEYQFIRKDKRTHFVPSWHFQSNIPTLFSACKITRPDYSVLEKKVTGDWPLLQDSLVDFSDGLDKKQLINYYAMKKVPGFTSEPYMSSSKDYRYRIDFMTDPHESVFHVFIQSHNIWQGANLWLLQAPFFGGQFYSKIPDTKQFVDSVKKLKNTSAKIKAVCQYVKRKIKWNNYYFFLSRDLEEVWKEGVGTSGEINLSILNLLRKCDVPCYPVLYSTRRNGRVDYNFPDLSQFNTVNIAVVNGNRFNLLDGTNPWLSYDTPPLNVVNRTGMLIDFSNHSRINIDFDRKLLRDSVWVYASIDSHGMIKGKKITKYFDLARAVKLQNDAEDENDDEDEHEHEKSGESTNSTGLQVDSTYQLGKEDELSALTEVSTFHYQLPPTDDFYFLEPFLFSSLSKNPFTANTRKTDVDFIGNTSSVLHVEISLPNELKVEDIAKEKAIQASDSSVVFRYQNEMKNNTLYINNIFEINKPFFTKDEYPALRTNFENIYGLLGKMVVLRKDPH
jgi:hypothetical protein